MSAPSTNRRPWDVLLIGGASGSGKTSVSYRLAQHFGVGITEIDDFQVILERMTTPEQLPALHFWRTHPDPASLTPELLFDQMLAIGEALSPALEAVIDNHLDSDTPVILEGDFLLPALPARLAVSNPTKYARLRTVFIHEPSEAQLVSNYASREPDSPPQTLRARVSILYGDWLKRQAEQYGLSVAPSRPWETLFDRLLALLT